MQFVRSGMFAALVALAIPILIHLMARPRSRPVELGTLQFLKVVLRDNARKRRLKRLLLLALRLGCVALLAMLFARPFFLTEEPTQGDRLVVALVDRSASMGLAGGDRPIDRVSAELRSILSRTGPGVRLEVAAFDRDVAPFAKATEAPSAFANPLAAGTDYDAAMAWVRDLCVRSGGTRKELHILTDLQRSGLGRGEAAKLPAEVAVRLVDLGRPFPKNVAVTGVAASPPNPRPRESVVVTATVRNTSPLPVAQVPIRLHLEAEGASPIDVEKLVDLDGDATATIEFSPLKPDEGIWKGYVEAKTGDDLLIDDRRYLALGVAPAAQVLLVNGDSGGSVLDSETYFLKAALKLAPERETYAKAPFDPREIEPTGTLAIADATAAVVLANVADLSAGAARGLAEFVAKGGGLVVFTGDKMTSQGVTSLVDAGLGVGKVIGPVAAAGRPWRLERWEAAHPLLRPFSEPEHGDLRRPAFSVITKIVPDPSARVLATFRGGDPALLEHAVGRGRVLWFASACDRGWGDWPKGRMFLPMIHQMVAYASGLSDGGPVRSEMAGVHPPGLVEADGVVRVINLDPFESELARCTPEEFAGRYGFTLAGIKPDDPSPTTSRPADDRLRGDEIWPWVALTLIGILMCEQFLANRTAA